MKNSNNLVFIYTGVTPNNTGSGAQVRVYTNICAYIDLGYKVEVILFVNDASPVLPHYFLSYPVKFTIINNCHFKQTIFDRIGYCLGWPKVNVLNWLFPIRKYVRVEVEKRIVLNTKAIHHFEYLNVASATLGLNGSFIYSNHDLVSDRYLKIESERDSLIKGKNLLIRYYKYHQLRRAEKWIAITNKIVLTVSQDDTVLYKNRIKSGTFKLLPWSWPDESAITRSRDWIENDIIKILHLGSLNSMIPYSSLKFILSNLFENLPNEIINRIQLLIVGNDPDAPYSNRIKYLASKYNNVNIMGYVEDINPLFDNCDLQIVGSQFSTGIRTRIIESFVRGLPVISTYSAAKGMYGLEHKKNIYLADKPDHIKNIIDGIFMDRSQLEIISKNARLLYEKEYSRKMQTERLQQYIYKYIN